MDPWRDEEVSSSRLNRSKSVGTDPRKRFSLPLAPATVLYSSKNVWNSDNVDMPEDPLNMTTFPPAPLEVDLANLSLEQKQTSKQPQDYYAKNGLRVNDNDYDWMFFVFDERELGTMFNVFVTAFRAERAEFRLAPSKLFYLAARYAYLYTPKEKRLLNRLIEGFLATVWSTVEADPTNMVLGTMWISNCVLLYYYLHRDSKLVEATRELQEEITRVVPRIYSLVYKDAIRRMDEAIVAGMLNYAGLEGLDPSASRSWNLLRRHSSVRRPGSPRSAPVASPRNLTKVFASTLHLMELFYIHPLIRIQCIEQLFTWFGARLFNLLLVNKKYHSRAYAMEIRFNVASVEEWIQKHNIDLTHPTDYSEVGLPMKDLSSYLQPVVQLLQWLQCLSRLSADRDPDALRETVRSFSALSPHQVISVAKSYKLDSSEARLTGSFYKVLNEYEQEWERERITSMPNSSNKTKLEPMRLDENRILPFVFPTFQELVQAYSPSASPNVFAKEREYLYKPYVSNYMIDLLETSGITMERAELPVSIFENEAWKKEWRPEVEEEELFQ
ncbi:fungal protein [Schizosaccharomyces japonicus yFS275]|uniref:Fungal protein n=1 Tax=Schizosaccharomyces japonicus (strain yFS275 / FY16936) TaxID=402676 RepID=B6K2Z5_SCHJY|nr:fungal protein [Schizosaccharomyces japonicus yFS275]EEB07852.1 fungal protein [Schizosaccharomyces japonicus yFS275]